MFYVVGTDGSLVRWNDTVSSVTGYTNEKLPMAIGNIVADSDNEKSPEVFDDTVALDTEPLESVESMTTAGSGCPARS